MQKRRQQLVAAAEGDFENIASKITLMQSESCKSIQKRDTVTTGRCAAPPDNPDNPKSTAPLNHMTSAKEKKLGQR